MHNPSSRNSRRKRQTTKQTNPNVTMGESSINAWNLPIDQSGWGEEVANTSLDARTTEHQTRVDGLSGLILYWRTGVYAAERGEEVLKMERFYEEQEALALAEERDGGWGLIRPDQDPWGVEAEAADQDAWGEVAEQGWGKGGWLEEEWNSGKDVRWGENTVGRNSDGTERRRVAGDDLVSKFAQDARPERRKQLYEFLKLPPEDKVQKIQAMIYLLNANGT